jgi:hypothetical protein
VVFFWGVKKDWTRAATMLDETPDLEELIGDVEIEENRLRSG